MFQLVKNTLLFALFAVATLPCWAGVKHLSAGRYESTPDSADLCDDFKIPPSMLDSKTIHFGKRIAISLEKESSSTEIDSSCKVQDETERSELQDQTVIKQFETLTCDGHEQSVTKRQYEIQPEIIKYEWQEKTKEGEVSYRCTWTRVSTDNGTRKKPAQ